MKRTQREIRAQGLYRDPEAIAKSNLQERDPEQPLPGFGEGNARWVFLSFVCKAFKQKKQHCLGKKKK